MFSIKDLQCVFGRIEIFGKSPISLSSSLHSIPLMGP